MDGRKRVILAALITLAALMTITGCRPAAPTPTPLPPTPARIVVTMPPRPTTTSVEVLDKVRGKVDAPITWTLYGNFRAEASVTLARNLLILIERYPDQVRLVWRHYPTRGDALSLLAASGAEAAGAQGKFWEMHDTLLATRGEWFNATPTLFRELLTQYAAQSDVPDLAAFNAALDKKTYDAPLEQAIRAAGARGFRSSPALMLQNRPYRSDIDEFGLDSAVQLILLKEHQFSKQPPFEIDPNKRYRATLITAKGEVEIELFTQTAPVTVNNFVYLARQGWYDGITFHLVTPELVQTGDPSGTGEGTAGYTIFDEADNGLTFDRAGLVAMASQRGVRNSGSSQFFITLGIMPPEGYNGEFAIFGQVTKGMDVLRLLRERNPFDLLRFPNPPPGDALLRVIITESALGE